MRAMPIRPYAFDFDQVYHIYNRGVNKKKLFFINEDYEHFLKGIEKYHKSFPSIVFLAYCILPNHFHFLLLEKSSPGSSPGSTDSSNISKYMNFIQQSYAMYFNARYKKNKAKGPVYEGRFQARLIEGEDYLSYVNDYIEYNPVKHKIVSDPSLWKYSSFHYGNEDRKTSKPLWKKDFGEVFD